MFDELNKYKSTNHFFFRPTDNLGQVCNAPTDKSGVYLIYALKGGQIELIYIGRSGEVKSDGKLFIRKAGLGGLKDRLVNGKQFGEPRRNSWRTKTIEEKIEVLDVYWYVTHSDSFTDCPRILENKLLHRHQEIFGQLPRWNNELYKNIKTKDIMASRELQTLKEIHIKKLVDNFNQLERGRSYNPNKLKRLQENLEMWSEFLKSVNKLANEFIDDLNSPTYNSFPDKEKEEINEIYRTEVKEMVLTNNRKFLLDE